MYIELNVKCFLYFVICLKPFLLYIAFGYIVFTAVPKKHCTKFNVQQIDLQVPILILFYINFPCAHFPLWLSRTELNGKCNSKSKNIAMLQQINCLPNCLFKIVLLFLWPIWLMLMYMNCLFCAQDLYIHLRHGPNYGPMKMLMLQLSLGLHGINAAADLVSWVLKPLCITEVYAQFSCFCPKKKTSIHFTT